MTVYSLTCESSSLADDRLGRVHLLCGDVLFVLFVCSIGCVLDVKRSW